MDARKHCAECEEIISEMRAALLNLITRRTPQNEPLTRKDFMEFLTGLFASEQDLARLSELWDQSEFGTARHRWMEHRIATGHTPVLGSALN